MMMKKFLLFLLILAVLLLSSCRVVDSDLEVLEKSRQGELQWTYSLVTARCALDRETSTMVCNKILEGDTTYLSNLLITMGSQGWEFTEVIHTSDADGMLQTFVFRKLVQ
jgi:hypothetical protein